MVYKPALGLTQPRIQWVPGVLILGVKRQGHESSAEVKEGVELYLHSPILLHGVVFS